MTEMTKDEAAPVAGGEGAAGAQEAAPAPAEAAAAAQAEAPAGASDAAADGAPAGGGAPGRTLGESLSAEAMEKVASEKEGGRPNIDLIMNIPVRVQVVLGEARMSIASLMKLGPGSIVPLNRKVGEPIEVMVNGRLVARGEVVLLEDDSERFGISLTEIVEPGGNLC